MNKFTFKEKLSIIVNVLTLFSLIFVCLTWFYKTSELPKVVDNHEKRISNIEKQMAENTTKTELIYQSVLEIRRVLMYK